MPTGTQIRKTIKANYLQPAFLICAAVLAISASSISMVVKLSGIYLTKEPLPLKKNLDQMNLSRLSPYKLMASGKIDNQDVLETLGTEDYTDWTLEDTSAPAESNARLCSLFITYYAVPDKVPHVPDECYIGGGFQRINSETVTLKINRDGEERSISARYIVFAATQPDILVGEVSFPVLYLFSVNGEYAGGREDTRMILNKNLFAKFSYFSKVEWKFYNTRFGRIIYPDKQEALEASEKLLAVILPVLEKDHWPSGLW